MKSLRQLADDEEIQAIKTQSKNDYIIPYTCLDNEETKIVMDRITREVLPLVQEPSSLRPLRMIAKGINEVTRILQRRDASVIVLSNDPSVLRISAHVMTMAHVLNIPICILATTSTGLGKLLKLKRLSIFGIRRMSKETECKDETQRLIHRLSSIRDFIIAKACDHSLKSLPVTS
jgi:ribonuclease P/MRP protein subunit RPP38